MRNITRFATALLLIFAFNGCANFQANLKAEGTKIKAWWTNPTTQEKVQAAGKALAAYLLATGLEVGEQALLGQKINKTTLTKTALQNLASTISTQGPALRQLQGTNLILDPDATALALAQSGTPKEAAKTVALSLVRSIEAQMADGLSANAASENVAQKLDTASAIGALGVTP
jgi:hypothetical protein